MKIKNVFLLLFIAGQQLLLAQSEKPTYSFVIKGKVANNNELSWSFANTSFLDNEITEISIKEDGTFNQIVPIEGIQQLYLYLNDDAISIFVQPNDTIEVNWDAKNFKKSFQLKSPNQIRNNELQLNLQLYNEFREEEMSLREKLREIRNQPDSIKYRMINDQYNKQLKAVIHPVRAPKFIYDVYFKYINLLYDSRLLEKYSLEVNPEILNSKDSVLVRSNILASGDYKILNDAIFYQSPEYRDFLFNYIRKGTFLMSTGSISNVVTITNRGDTIPTPYTQTKFYKNNAETLFNFVWNDYYNGMANIPLLNIREWFVTKAIIFGFERYSFEETESVLNDFLPKCQSEVYKEILIAKYNFVKTFKKGKPAPQFTLKDETGKTVSLSDFKGKYVYLDFWGVGCGPCIYDIKNHSPKLHEKYKDKNIVFINISVDENESNWKKALTKYHLDGVNLLAEGWTRNPVCKAYDVNAIPHYVLIDKEGNFIEHRAPRPSEKIDALFDKLLLEK